MRKNKSITKLLLLVFLFLSSFVACIDGEGGHAHQHANDYMNQSNFEDLVKRFEGEERDQWQKPNLLVASLGDLRAKTVVDIGAGTGYFAFKLLEQANKVIAVDVDERFTNYMEERSLQQLSPSLRENLDIRLAEPHHPHLKAGEADLVLIVNTYHHIENRVNYFQNLQKNLSQDGELVIVDFKKVKMPIGPPKKMKISAKKVVSELEEAGYTDIKVNSDLLPYQYVITAS